MTTLGYDEHYSKTTINHDTYSLTTISMPTVGYQQVIRKDFEGRTLAWWDSNGESEYFRYELKGYKKNGEPEYECVIISSTIKLVLNEEKFYSKAAYMQAVLTQQGML